MNISEATSKRILHLCQVKDISINKLALLSGITQSTLQSIISCKSKNPKMLTIIRICYGLNVSIKEFFNDELFNNLDIEL